MLVVGLALIASAPVGMALDAATRQSSADVRSGGAGTGTWTSPLPPVAARRDADGDGVPDHLGDTLIVAGRASSALRTLDRTKMKVFVQAGSAGLLLFRRTARGDIAAGDSVVARGVVESYHGLTQLEVLAYRVAARGLGAPAPVDLSRTNGPLERYEGQLVRLKGVVLESRESPAGRHVLLGDPAHPERRVAVFISSARVPLLAVTRFSVGDRVTATGPLGQYATSVSAGYEIYPRTEADVGAIGVTRRQVTAVALMALALGALVVFLLYRRGRRRRRRLTDVETVLRVLLDQAPAAVWSTDRSLRYTMAEGRAIAPGASTRRVGTRLREHFADATDGAAVVAAHQRALEGEPGSYQMRLSDRVLEAYVRPVRARSGEIIGVAGVAFDVTEHERMEEALRLRNEELDALLRSVPLAVAALDREGRVLSWNPAAEQIFGWREEEVVGRPYPLVPEGPEEARRLVAASLAGAVLVGEEVVRQRRDGSLLDVAVWASPRRDARGDVIGTTGILADISERKRSETALDHSISLLRATLESTADGILVVDSERRVVDCNRKFLEMWRIPDVVVARGDEATLLEHLLRQVRDPADFAARVESIYADPEARVHDMVAFADGRTFERYSQPQRIGGRTVGRVWSFRDVTERIRAETALRESEQRYRTLVEQAADAVLVVDARGRIRDVNERACESLGYTRAEMLAMGVADVSLDLDAAMLPELWRRVRGGEAMTVEGRQRRRDGSVLHVEVRMGPTEIAGEPLVLAIARDISERRRAERALRESEERFRLMVEGSEQVFFFSHDVKHRFTYISPSVESVLGYPADELLGRPFDVLHHGHPTDDEVDTLTRRALETGVGQRAYTAMAVHRDGRSLPLEVVESPLIRDGEVVGLQGFARDISERLRSERALRESEEQLRQAQKMEAVGRLAGGIAHDFNNITTVIIGHADLVLMDLPAGHALGDDAREIRDAAERAATLTRHLLAFSRKQILQVRVLDVNEVITGISRMLQRMIGEDIVLRTQLAPDVDPVEADPAQIEQVIMNLVVNGRDAMPDGGELTIATSRAALSAAEVPGHLNLAPGAYARITVTDTGCGLTPEVRGRMFEPFFTTKADGKGTGLGLSTVYGIVKQSGGEIDVSSEAGQGTSITLYLPATMKGAGGRTPPTEATPSIAGGETVLLVEDEPGVRKMARRSLERCGYQVLEACDGAEALELAANHRGAIDLLVTDVVMPVLGGRDLAERISVIRPTTPVLFTSGYTEDEVFRRGLSGGDQFLPKPFSPAILTRRVREMLDATMGRA